MKAKTVVPGALLALALLVPAAARAHVTVQPSEAPAGAYAVLDVRVPNETDHANTTKVAVQFPAGFGQVSYQPVPGWRVRVVRDKPAKPIQTDDGPITEGVREVILSGSLPPGRFQDFPLSMQIPGKPGEELTFKALQTYDDGEVVRWIGGPESEHPAPRVLVTAVTEPGRTASALAGEANDSGSSDDGLAIAALPIAAIALIVAAAALLGARRRAA
ncbi:MAG: YcnI family protein [Actinobacteria bacterium]|nr:YcnI family protein [Actinomycetota bacterium]